MSEFVNKYLNSTGVKHLWDKAGEIYVKKESGKALSDENYTYAEKVKLASLQNYDLPTASSNSLGGIKIGDGLVIDANGVVRTVHNPEMPVEWDTIQDLPTTLAGYGITDAATKGELEVVRASVNKVYKYCGQVSTVADLENIQNPENGDVYDVAEDGSNYAWNEDEERWDSLGSSFKIESLSNYELDIITGSASSETALKELLVKGGSVDLGANITLTMSVAITKNTTLNLRGNTLTYSGSGYAFAVDDATLTLKNGTITTSTRIAQADNEAEIVIDDGSYTSGDVAFSAVGANSKITVNGGSISGQEGSIGAFDGAGIEINGGRIVGLDNPAVFTPKTSGRGNNNIVLNNGEVIGNIESSGFESCGVYIANNDTFVMNGGSVTANCGVLMRAGSVTINGGTIRSVDGANIPGKIGDDTTLMSGSAVIYHESANYPGKSGMSLTITGGTLTAPDFSVSVLSNEATPNITVSGGTFVPPYTP